MTLWRLAFAQLGALLFNTSGPSVRRSHPRSMSSSWADACLKARNLPLQQQFDAAYGSCSATVRRAIAAGVLSFASVSILLSFSIISICFPTLFRSDCCLLRERRSKWHHVLSVAARQLG
jgi:hypothetical protein